MWWNAINKFADDINDLIGLACVNSAVGPFIFQWSKETCQLEKFAIFLFLFYLSKILLLFYFKIDKEFFFLCDYDQFQIYFHFCTGDKN